MLALIAFVLGNLWWLRGPILWSLACPLVVDDPTPAGCYLWLRSDDGIFPQGALSCNLPVELKRRTPQAKFLLVDTRPSRLAEFGILPSFVETVRRDLAARGVPKSDIEVLPGGPRGLAAELTVVSRFLADHPKAQVQLFCGRFSGGVYRRTVDRLLAPDRAARVSFFAVISRDFNETNWWQCRPGMREFMLHWLQRIYGDAGDCSARGDWDPDAYQRSLVRNRQEGRP